MKLFLASAAAKYLIRVLLYKKITVNNLMVTCRYKESYLASIVSTSCHRFIPKAIWVHAWTRSTRPFVHLNLAKETRCCHSRPSSNCASSLFSKSLPYLPPKTPARIINLLVKSYVEYTVSTTKVKWYSFEIKQHVEYGKRGSDNHI